MRLKKRTLMANSFPTEASRAKHKFAVKRNSWPKTRGVAMNPVDHVRLPSMILSIYLQILTCFLYSLTVVVTTSTLVRPRPSPATLPRVKKPVLSLPGELVCSVVPRRPRSKRDIVWSFLCDGLKMLFCYEAYVLRRLRIISHASLANLGRGHQIFS